jgi:hypothetical protein
MAKSASSGSSPVSKEAKNAQKSAKKAAGKERRSQIWQAFQMQRREDKALLPIMIGILLGVAAVVTGLGVLIGLPWWAVLVLGLLIGALVALLVFSRRVQANVYKKAEGQPGAAAWSLQNNLRGRWRVSAAVAGTAQLDAVHRLVGRPGVILVGEGAPHRLKPLMAQEKKRISRVVGSTPIYDVIVGNDEGQVPLRKLNTWLLKLPRNIAANAVPELDNRLSALAARTAQSGLPKGPLPAGVKMRNVQRATRRR